MKPKNMENRIEEITKILLSELNDIDDSGEYEVTIEVLIESVVRYAIGNNICKHNCIAEYLLSNSFGHGLVEELFDEQDWI